MTTTDRHSADCLPADDTRWARTARQLWLQVLTGGHASPQLTVPGTTKDEDDFDRIDGEHRWLGKTSDTSRFHSHTKPQATDPSPNVIDLRDHTSGPPTPIQVAIVDPAPYYAEAVAYALQPDERFHPIHCFTAPGFIPSYFQGVIVLTVRHQDTLDLGLATTAERLPHCPIIIVNPTNLPMQYITLIAYPGPAFRLKTNGITALKRTIINVAAIEASPRRPLKEPSS